MRSLQLAETVFLFFFFFLKYCIYLSLRAYADPARQEGFRQRLIYQVGIFGELISSTILSETEINFVLRLEAIFYNNRFDFDDQLIVFKNRS